MLHIKFVLFIIVANCYVSCTMLKNHTFNELTLIELNESCTKNNQSYKNMQTSLLPIWNNLLNNTTRHCSGQEIENLIRQLINETMKCFEINEHLSETNNIVAEIKKKICAYYKIGNFKVKYSDCIIFATVQECISNQNIKINDYFFSLAMTHTKSECEQLMDIMACTRDGMTAGCGPSIADKYKIIMKEFKDSLRCEK
ncbi:uncharacterized protein LOC122506507 [Leptopilina heterotoma]|uniref:uncharacterized protein LOC122506507 n=1 Tax=Leptopilina heterotoma TaxID=63436 RepID=UPI001CA8ABCB|nr:uncharacterized protein LOC122506507 [Leptopilina heterotoma]